MKGRKNTSSILRHRLTLQSESQTPDGSGGYVRSWENVADLWAQVLPVRSTAASSREYLFAGQLQAVITHIVLLRYRSDVDASRGLVFHGHKFNNRGVLDPDG